MTPPLSAKIVSDVVEMSIPLPPALGAWIAGWNREAEEAVRTSAREAMTTCRGCAKRGEALAAFKRCPCASPAAAYCGRDCQALDWRRNKEECAHRRAGAAAKRQSAAAGGDAAAQAAAREAALAAYLAAHRAENVVEVALPDGPVHVTSCDAQKAGDGRTGELAGPPAGLTHPLR